ncbi:unnamed protein product, partial [Scytosiphon promiscuus]
GIELRDSDVPSPDHDIFIVARSCASAAVGRCSATTMAVAFREPGKTAFDLDLPVNSSLASVKAALMDACRRSREEQDGQRRGRRCYQPRQRQQRRELSTAEGALAEIRGEGSEDDHDHDCTLIIAGTKMSGACLLGDHLIKMSAIRSRSGQTTRRRPAPILVLWHPPHRTTQQDRQAAVAKTLTAPKIGPRAFAGSPAASGATATTETGAIPPGRRVDLTLAQGGDAIAFTRPIPPREGSQENRGCEGRRRGLSRRSIQRRCKSVVRFSGLQKGARSGLGIRPLSE